MVEIHRLMKGHLGSFVFFGSRTNMTIVLDKRGNTNEIFWLYRYVDKDVSLLFDESSSNLYLIAY